MIIDNIKRIKEEIPSNVLLVAVTKTRSVDEINQAIKAGITDIGENKVQEIVRKYDSLLPVNIHMIGHLQTNKVKDIVGKVCLIHSVDSFRLADEINKQCQKQNTKMDILIQVNVARENTKFGINEEELKSLIEKILQNHENITIKGLMTIAPIEGNANIVFKKLKLLFEDLKSIEHPRLRLQYLSMGMTNDYMEAIKEGSNLIRIGTGIFGERK